MRVRNRVIDAFERAEREQDRGRRRALLTFVVAGGGFAGVELAGALNDFARGMLADFPELSPGDVRVVLVHAGQRILPELSATLGAYAEARLRERGVEFRLGARVKDARPGEVVIDPPETIDAETLVWTAGARPNPLVETLPVARDRRGAVIVDATLAVPDHAGVWAGGDCAAVTDARSGKPCPPTAQFALREAKTLAANIHADHHGRPRKPFHFDALGVLAVVGHQTACAELAVPPGSGRTLRFSGLLAALWRAITCPSCLASIGRYASLGLGDRALLPSRHRPDRRDRRAVRLRCEVNHASLPRPPLRDRRRRRRGGRRPRPARSSRFTRGMGDGRRGGRRVRCAGPRPHDEPGRRAHVGPGVRVHALAGGAGRAGVSAG
jgi:NADH dehydrogenase FAD-containing subunit